MYIHPLAIPVHRHEIYEEIKNSTLDAAESQKVDVNGIRKKIQKGNGQDDQRKDRGEGGG